MSAAEALPGHARAGAESGLEYVLTLRPPLRGQPEERIAAILLIHPDEWQEGKTTHLLAKHWGGPSMTPEDREKLVRRLEKDATDAHRIRRFQQNDWVKQRLELSLDKALTRAESRKASYFSTLDYVRAVSEVAKVWAPIAGVVQPPGQVNIQMVMQHPAVAAVWKMIGEELDRDPDRSAGEVKAAVEARLRGLLDERKQMGGGDGR